MAMHVAGSDGHMTLHFKDVVGVGTKGEFIKVGFLDGRVFELEFNSLNDRDRAYKRIKQEQEEYAKTVQFDFEMKCFLMRSIPWVALFGILAFLSVASKVK